MAGGTEMGLVRRAQEQLTAGTQGAAPKGAKLWLTGRTLTGRIREPLPVLTEGVAPDRAQSWAQPLW